MSTVVFVLGAPGSGKGTQCAKIVERYGWTHLSTGDLLRAEVAAETDLGKEAADIMKTGQMVPTSMVLDLISKAMATNGGTQFLVDGFPRTLDQLHDFEAKVQACEGVLVFTIPDDVAVSRLVARGESSGRADDNETTILARLSVFKSESQAVIDALAESGRVAQIDAQAAPDEVFESVVSFMELMEEKCARLAGKEAQVDAHLGHNTEQGVGTSRLPDPMPLVQDLDQDRGAQVDAQLGHYA